MNRREQLTPAKRIEQYGGDTNFTMFRCTVCGARFQREGAAPVAADSPEAIERVKKQLEMIEQAHQCRKKKR